MAKSISVYDIIDFTLSIVLVGFRGLTVEVQPSRRFDSRKGLLCDAGQTTVRYRYRTVPYRAVPYRTENILIRTVLLRFRNGKINVSYEVRFRKS